MFNQPPDKPRASDFNSDPFGFGTQAWGRFGFDNPSTEFPSHQHHDPSQSMQGPVRDFTTSAQSHMDWTPDLDAGFQYHDNGNMMSSADNMDFENLNPTHSGGSVGRLVAHFENKGYVPPLPPRPIGNQEQAFGTSPAASSQFGSLSSIAHTNRLTSPLTNPSDYGSFDLHSPATSPIATRSGMSFGSFQDTQPMHSPVHGSSMSPFGSLDEFIKSERLTSPMVHTPMAPTPTMVTPTQESMAVPGTPGFEIWRPPPSATPKPAQPNSSSSSAFNGYFRPPVPTTPKPAVNAVNQFILEFNPTTKHKGKAPVKPPRPRLPSRKPVITQAQMAARLQKHAQATSATPTIPSSTITPAPVSISSPTPSASVSAQTPMSPPPLPTRPSATIAPPVSAPLIDQQQQQQTQETVPSRAQAGTRPSREQVPAEAWEQFKTIIRTLYLEERRPLKEVMNIMSEKHGFQATPKMYKTRFSQWGFVKNNTEEEVKRLLSMKFQRDAEGKVSEFVRNGRVVNLGTYLKRKGVTEYDLVDFELPADLPAHIRCRTPTPPPALKSPDLLRAQELVVGNMRKVFLHCRQFEVETDTQIGWPSIMVWGAGSSDLLLEANFYFEARDADQGGDYLMRAFKQLEMDLRKLSPPGIMELILGMINRDPGMMTALCKYLAAFSTTNLDRTHPLRQIFTCLYEVQQKHGASTLSELLWTSMQTISEELEAIYGRRHPYVARTWVDLALFYNQPNMDRIEKLVPELRALLRQLEQRHGNTSAEVIPLRYTILQLLYVAAPQSPITKQAAADLWNLLRSMGAMFPMRDARTNAYCYHSPVKVDPWTKRCRRRYDSGVSILEEHVGVKIHPYFEEDFHTTEHAIEAQDAWASALSQMGAGGPRTWGFI